MASNWNRWLERMMTADLTQTELRLAMAIARYTLGYNRTSGAIGQNHLQECTGLKHRRSFVRARDGLVAAGLLRFTSHGPGRGHRDAYEWLLEPAEMRAPERAFDEPLNARSPGMEMRAPERARRDNRKGSTGASQPTPVEVTRVFDAYLSAGGSLELDQWRAILGHQAASLAKEGIPARTVEAAAAQLGREHAFPGYLSQRARAMHADGGPCTWDGLDRARLTVEQLSECGCGRCEQWLHHRSERAGTPARLREEAPRT